MFTFDERIRGLPAARDQVVALYQSINSPHLAIPGKQAGPAQAFIVGVRGPAGFVVFVYLFLAEVADCAVYVPDRRNLSAEDYKDLEAEAVAFVESMGFMVDNMNFRTLSAQQQDELLKTLPVFIKDPKLAPPPPSGPGSKATKLEPPQAKTSINSASLARLFTSF